MNYFKVKKKNISIKKRLQDSFYGALIPLLMLMFGGMVTIYSNDYLAIRAAKLKMKQEVYIAALEVVDAHFSNLTWSSNGAPIPIERQLLKTADARAVMDKLVLISDSDIVNAYLAVLGLPKKGEADLPITEKLNKLRYLMRKDLGLGDVISLPGDRAWIGALQKPDDGAPAGGSQTAR